MAHSLAICLALICPTTASTTFDTTCTSPNVTVNYVTSASTRGTLDILWSCLFTIVACTWTVLHLNVPLQRDGRDPGILGDIKWALKRSLNSMKWMLVTVIAPEILIGKYWADLRVARRDLKKLEKWAREDEVPWTLSHSLFANMGGFCLRTYASERVGKQYNVGCQSLSESQDGGLEEDSAQHPTKSVHLETIACEAPVAMSTSVSREEEGAADPSNDVCPEASNAYHLDMEDILRLRQSGALTRLPYLTVDELHDRSKSDSLIRFIAIGQILWITIQILARAVRRLAISQLEIAVLAFACCAVVMYSLNWHKPKAVGVPITILSYRGKMPSIVVKEVVQAEMKPTSFLTNLVGLVEASFGVGNEESGALISNAYIRDPDVENALDDSMLGFVLASMVFGGIHLAAWKFTFPTRTEQILWWSAALWCTCFSAIFYLWTILYFKLADWIPYLEDYIVDPNIGTWSIWAPGGLYVVARLYLVVEIFRTLCFLPPDAYIATWATNVPHLG